MAYVVKLTPRAQTELADYIASFSHDASLQRSVTDHIQAALELIAADPRIGKTPRHPLGRPTRIAEFDIDGVVRYVKIVYRYEESEDAIAVLTIKNVSF